MKQTKSLGFGTDLFLAAFDGELSSGDGYVAARTPASPQFWWGNFVLFTEPPQPGDQERWEAIFDEEVGRVPGVRHRNLAWDVTDGSVGAAQTFVEQGYTLTQDVFLTTSKATPAIHHREDIQVRPLKSVEDWRRATEIEVQSFNASASFQEFTRQQMIRNRAVVERGIGLWFGAFCQSEMVATMGLFVDGRLGRCQAVATAPEHRRRGCAGTLVHGVCSYGFAQMGVEQVILATTLGTAPARVYQSVGFQLSERVSSLSLAGE